MRTDITNEVFADFTECKHRAYLRLAGKIVRNSEFSDIERRMSQDYRARACQHLLQSYTTNEVAPVSVSMPALMNKRYRLATDLTIREGDMVARLDGLMAASRTQGLMPPTYIPIMFGHEEKVSRKQKLLLAFCGSVLGVQQGANPPFGRIVHGCRFRNSKIQFDRLLGEAGQIVRKVRALKRANDPPPVHLNTHCATCEFRPGCRAIAVEKDHLSLLRGIKQKEIIKLNSKGIFTVTQLSYTFRPRKRSRRSNPRAIRHHHSLKALAIRENWIYVTGSPELTTTGTPVYLDVEGIPDQDSYYLIGLKVVDGESSLQYSFWADDRAEEEKIWRECLNVIDTVDSPQLFHYGRYETTFLKRMKKRYSDAVHDGTLLDRLIEGAQNVLSVIYGQIYFPTYSNGLKDVAPFLGYTWSSKNPSGKRSVLCRRRWEATRNPEIKDELITYNAEDCEALEVVVKTITQLVPGQGVSATTVTYPNATHTDSLKPQSPYSFGPADFALPELERINKCAYWDYQRDRIYIRSNARLGRSMRKKERQKKKRKLLPVNRTVGPSRSWECPRCRSSGIAKWGRHSKLLYDLKFSAGGVKRWVIKYVIVHYRCNNCDARFASDEHNYTRHRYGLQLLAYVIYSMIELHVPQLKLAQSVSRLFGYPLTQSTINRLKTRATELYRGAYEAIKERLLHGNVIHADETPVSIKTGAGYVWVFTSMEDVVYLWSETREGYVAREFLGTFKGVLVSDFYSAYDSIGCLHQRCLIHLIRDLNSDILKEPFNEELKALVHDFAALLKPMIETIDRFGLKKYFLKKHKKDVTRFYKALLARDYETEIVQKAQERFNKNRDKLFTFLDHDGVPWNNNNAEHAIKGFLGLHDVIQCGTNERGLRDYLMLLSICQSCIYKGVDFLDFLRSG